VIGWLGFVVVVLAVYRTVRFVTADTLTERARDRLYRWAWVEVDEPSAYRAAWLRWRGDEPFPESVGVNENPTPPMPRAGGFRTYLSELFQCSWCLGVWASFVAVAVWWWAVRDGGSVLRYVFVALAVAGAQGFIASRADA
jgi:hypothetical protein